MHMQFIHISREEMEAVAQFIKQRGRIAITALAHQSNTFIDLSTRDMEAEGSYLDLSVQG